MTLSTVLADTVILQMAQKLRGAMEEPLYLQQLQQQQQHAEYVDPLLQMILLASKYPPEVLTLAVLLTSDESLRLPIHLAWYVLSEMERKGAIVLSCILFSRS